MGEEHAVIIPLKILLNNHGKELDEMFRISLLSASLRKVKNLLNTFKCSKNIDVENFLKNSSILFE
ncbi:hypothetical protein [Methanothermococcus thermolithotrophicus]|uniref:hypothetical protein n=1 Tax=Methanothermococcus thermolithotrophicus TaxID=2186 RepID=UPI00036AC109|nr:hypothetical protein [Methanothermococcus thermolithotrophicus]